MSDRESNATRIIDWPVRETSTAEEMAAFDALPYAVRAWLNFTSPAKFCALSIWEIADRKEQDAAEIVRRLDAQLPRWREKARLDLLAQGLVA